VDFIVDNLILISKTLQRYKKISFYLENSEKSCNFAMENKWLNNYFGYARVI